jgi:hypothetical protein
MNGFKRSRAGGVLCATVIIASLALAPSALAQGSSVDTYSGTGGNVQSQLTQGGGSDNTVNTANTPSADPATTGSLPFTGFDLALAAGGGLALLGIGMVLARMTPAQSARH